MPSDGVGFRTCLDQPERQASTREGVTVVGCSDKGVYVLSVMYCTWFSYVLLRLNHCHVSKYAAPVLRAQPADMSNPNAPASLEPGHIVAGKKNVWVGTSTRAARAAGS